jgi:hypothetical protein
LPLLVIGILVSTTGLTKYWRESRMETGFSFVPLGSRKPDEARLTLGLTQPGVK